MKSLVVLLCSVLVIKQCMSACMQAAPDPAYPDGCYIESCLIPKNTTVTVWFPACLRCSCGGDGSYGCCDLYGYPTEYPDDCELVWFGCERRAVKKNDHKIECKVTAMIG